MRHIAATILSGLILATPLSGFAQSDTTFLARCNFVKGDPIAKVKEFYGTDFEAQKLLKVTPAGTAFQYHSEQYGVWVFFDDNQNISGLRFDAPFRGKIGGIAVGDDAANVRSLRGDPERQMQGFADEGAAQSREQRMRAIIDALPDPASKQRVLEAFVAALTLVREPITFTTAWIYNPGKSSFVRYEIDANNKVQNILADSCLEEASLAPATHSSAVVPSVTALPANCNFAVGDPVAKVKQFFAIETEPQRLASVTPAGSAFQYHFEQYGLWVFLDDHQLVASLRFDAPFRGNIAGVMIGDDADRVRAVRGEPASQFQGPPDVAVFKRRGERMRDLTTELQNPSNAARAPELVKELEDITGAPIPHTAAWVYNAGKPSFVRYEIGATDHKVETIFANACTPEG